MSSTEREYHFGIDPDRLGRAASHFARRVARDARTFAAHLEEHVGDFARDVWREGACAWRGEDRGHGEWRPPDVRRIFEDVRGVLTDVIDGIDELITSTFGTPSEEPWTRVVCNREASCGACGAALAAGGEAHVRRTARGTEFRCLACGAPPASAA